MEAEDVQSALRLGVAFDASRRGSDVNFSSLMSAADASRRG